MSRCSRCGEEYDFLHPNCQGPPPCPFCAAKDREVARLRAEVADLTRRLAVSVPADRWSYCPYCGIVAPRPGLHPDGCPGQEMQRAAHPLPPEKP